MNSCSNCLADNQEDSKFCRKCGQQLNEELSMKILFSATIANYFSVDSSLKRSIIPVLFKPGQIAKEFVSGKRTTFIHPAKFYLFSSFIFFIILGMVSNIEDSGTIQLKSNDLVSDTIAVNASDFQNILDSIQTDTEKTVKIDLGASEVKDFDLSVDSNIVDLNNGLSNRFLKGLMKLENGEGISGVFHEIISNLPYALILSVPLFAFFLLLILYKQPKQYASHLVFSLYYFTFSFIAWSVFFVIDYFMDLDMILGILIFLLIWWYLCKGIKRFYGLSWKKSILISIIQSVFYIIVILILTIILGFLAVSFG